MLKHHIRDVLSLVNLMKCGLNFDNLAVIHSSIRVGIFTSRLNSVSNFKLDFDVGLKRRRGSGRFLFLSPLINGRSVCLPFGLNFIGPRGIKVLPRHAGDECAARVDDGTWQGEAQI